MTTVSFCRSQFLFNGVRGSQSLGLSYPSSSRSHPVSCRLIPSHPVLVPSGFGLLSSLSIRAYMLCDRSIDLIDDERRKVIMEKSRGNAQFSFLFDASSPGGRFYRQVRRLTAMIRAVRTNALCFTSRLSTRASKCGDFFLFCDTYVLCLLCLLLSVKISPECNQETKILPRGTSRKSSPPPPPFVFFAVSNVPSLRH